MEILPLHFRTLYICGLWSESTSFSPLKALNTLFVFFLLFWYTLSHIIQFLKSTGTDEGKSGLFISAPYIAICMKMVNYLICIRDVTNLRIKFASKICEPDSQEEWDIFDKYRREINIMFVNIMLFTLMAGSAVLVTPVMNKSIHNFTLPLETYQPYPVRNWALYSFTYAWQSIGSFYGILIQVASDTMIFGFISLICAEYDIFCVRVMNIGKTNDIILLKKYIEHHVYIQDLIRSLQGVFMKTVTVLFCCSLLTLSGSIFNAIQVSIISIDFVSMMAYYFVMLLQIFMYCWFGGKLTDKSQAVSNAIYCADWIKLDSIERKSLRMIMLISSKGSVLSHHGQCILNMNTFAWILKASYTALNVLQQGANT